MKYSLSFIISQWLSDPLSVELDAVKQSYTDVSMKHWIFQYFFFNFGGI